jgi:hypothetical protein
LFIDTIIDDVEIVALPNLSVGHGSEINLSSYPREHMLVNEMETSFLRGGAFPLAVIHKTSILHHVNRKKKR